MTDTNTANFVVRHPFRQFHLNRILVHPAIFGRRLQSWVTADLILGGSGEIGRLPTPVKTVVRQNPNGYSGID